MTGIIPGYWNSCRTQHAHRLFLWIGAAVFALGSMSGLSLAADAEQTEIISVVGARAVGANTRGGAVAFSKVYHVTTLANTGPGSLRHAIDRSGPRIIVFDVGGIIRLKSDLRIFNPFITIAGQTAPDPGITITGGTMRIRTNDVIVQHVAIRPGPSNDPKVSVKRDAIAVAQCGKCRVQTVDILIDNVSLSWSSDELIGTNGVKLRQITVRNSILSEALAHGGHPKGSHTAGILIGQGVRGVEVVGNLFASNGFRNPAVNAGAAAVIINNYIYNPHNLAAHINAGPRSKRKTIATVIGNVLEPGPDTRKDVPVLDVARNIAIRTPNATIYAKNNQTSVPNGRVVRNISRLGLKSRPPLIGANWVTLQTHDVKAWAFSNAGSRPSRRNAIDLRILKGAQDQTGRIIDLPGQVGGLKDVGTARHIARVPQYPFSRSGNRGMLRIEAWLCLEHLNVGGPLNTHCAHTKAQLQDALIRSEHSPDRQID